MMTDTDMTRGTGNVFADLGFADATERQTKTRLAIVLNHVIEERGLKQVAVAKLLGIPQPKVSALVNYRLDGFSVERLMDFIVALGCDVEIIVRRQLGQDLGRLTVLEAA
jgi:predicted XRE-type DNA-binding protein